jgi:hypothetical protein
VRERESIQEEIDKKKRLEKKEERIKKQKGERDRGCGCGTQLIKAGQW